MTAGDWDLRGSEDLIIANGGGFFGGAGKFIVIDPEDGKERHRFPSKEILSGTPYTLGWARVGKEQSAVFLTDGGWPREVPVIGRDGAPLWTLGKFAGIDSVAWVDLDGAGSKTLVVGLNGGGGVRTFTDGRPRWNINPPGNIWTVAGIDASGGRPGLVVYCNGDDVSVVDSKGANVGTIVRNGRVTTVAASEMDAAGERQVVAVWPAVVGTIDYAIATDLKGKVLWKYPVNDDEMRNRGPTIIAADVTGDGTKEWIISPDSGELVVLDTRGQLLARIQPVPVRGWTRSWTAIERKGRPGLIVTADVGKLSAFTLSRKN